MLLRARAPSPPPGNSNTPLLKRGTIAALVLSSLAAFLVIIAALFYISKRRRRRRRARYQNQRRGHVSLNRLFPRKHSFRAHSDGVDGQEKDQVDSAKEQPFTGVILDIGHDSIEPVEINEDNMSPDGISNTGVCGGRRDSSKSSNSGFARWKKGLSTLSGLTALGLNFAHSDEKSPVSDDGDEREDDSSGLGVCVSHSLGRIGSNKSTGNGKGKGRLRGSSGSHDQSHDAESLSGLTSLSYVSNTAVYGHPPSYAASVSHNSGSGSNASLQLQTAPRAITRLSDSPPMFLSDQSILLDRARISGIHILGIGGALSSIGAPISAHVALRGLSPRISRSKISGKGNRRQKDTGPERKKEERGEEIKKRELPQPPGEQEASGSVALRFSSQVPTATTGSPIRALPPIPTSQPTPAPSQPQLSPLRLTESPSSYLTAPELLPFKPSSNQDPDTITPSPPSNNNTERRFKPRSSSSNVPGLGFPRGVQSFAEAAALAASLTTRGILVEGRGPGIGSDGEPGQGTPKRLSTASRVRFEDDPTDLNPSSGEARFTLSLPSGQSLPPDAVSPTSVQGSSRSSDHVATASFLDLSSQSSSPPSQQQSTKMELSTDIELESDRIWSMHLPGRRGAPKSEWNDTISPHIRSESSSSHSGYGSLRAQFSPVVPAPDAGTSDPPSNRHIFPFPLAIPPSQYMPEGFTGVEPSPSLISATTSIPVFVPPTSRRGHHDQRLHEPTTRISETTHDLNDNANDSQDHHEISPQQSNTHEGMSFSSPTDSFPQSISEVHFRTSVGVDSDVDLEPGRLQYARHYSVRPRHRHRHQHSHPPLPSMPLTPQRFHPQQEQAQSPSQQGSGGSSIVQKIFGGGGK